MFRFTSKSVAGRRGIVLAAAGAAVLGICQGVQTAGAAAFLWISAPGWSYSAAAAASPIGSIYAWYLSVGAGTWSWAYAYSHDAPFGSADAYAEASANGLGGAGALDVGGIADPYASLSIDDPSAVSPSSPSGYPTSNPATDPFSSSYTVSGTGITFNSGSSGSELNGVDALQAFTYNGGTTASALETALGATGSSGSSQAGDVTNMSTLGTDLSLIPLDNLVPDPSSLTSLPFTENTSGLNTANVILVADGSAASPEPGALPLLTVGALALLARRRVAGLLRG